jgi:PAS domain S-box-containing protein
LSVEIGELSCDAPPFTPEGAAAFLRAISEAAQDAVVMVDGAGRIAFWNRGAERIFGYAVAEVAGLHAHSLLAPARFRDRAEAALKAFASTGQGAAIGKTLELVGLRRDGVEIPVELSASSVMLGGQWYAVGILRDITGRKRAEEQLRVANAYLTSQIESAPDGVLIVDARTDKISFNRRYLDLWGFQPDVAATFDRTAVRAAMLALVRQPEQLLRAIEQSREQPDAPTNGELELKDGRTFEYDLTSMRDDQREFLAGICFFRDITARKRAAEELHNSQQLLEGILNAIPVRVFWKNKNLVYLGCNTIFARDAGFAEPKEIVGKDDYQLGWREQGDLYRRDDQSVIESGQSKFLIEEPQTTPDGKTIVLLTTKVPLRGPAGEIDGVLGAYMDITERKEAERRL